MAEENEEEVTPEPESGKGGLSRSDIVTHAREIAEGYRDQGLRLTVRQLYYQFVARGLLGSGQQPYKRIVAALSEARYEGRFPMDLIEDRGRDAGSGCHSLCEDDVDRALAKCRDTIGQLDDIYVRRDRWYGQDVFVSVWVEKEALSGVFEDPCNRLGVGLFACRGYPSVSSLYQWLKHLDRAVCEDREEDDGGDMRAGTAKRSVILYFGDHDPDGWEIPRSSRRNLDRLIQCEDQDTGEPLFPRLRDGEVDIQLVRVALNMDQVRRYNPPPFEAKISSSRCAGYVAEHGTHDAWELDALDPAVLRDLIQSSVGRYWDAEVYRRSQKVIKERRAQLREKMSEGGWFEEALGL